MGTKTNKKSAGTEEQEASIFKQVTGAIVGGTIALMAYYVYDYSAPVVTAWLLPSNYEAQLGHNAIADKDIDESDARRIQAQSRRIAANTQQVPEYSTYTRPVPIVVASSSSSAVFVAQQKSSSPENIWAQQPASAQASTAPSYIARASASSVPMPPARPVHGAEGDAVPQLPSSGFGLWTLLGAAGATVGSQYHRVRRKSSK